MSTVEVGGWTIYAHPLFLDQLEILIAAAEKARRNDPQGYKTKRDAKLLAAILKVAFVDIPSDPTKDVYRQGDTLGPDHRHWFRSKFLQQFRLFFRCRQTAGGGIIILAWINDEMTLRAYGSRSDAYSVFRKMLDRAMPPTGWQGLLDEARRESAKRRLVQVRSNDG